MTEMKIQRMIERFVLYLFMDTIPGKFDNCLNHSESEAHGFAACCLILGCAGKNNYQPAISAS